MSDKGLPKDAVIELIKKTKKTMVWSEAFRLYIPVSKKVAKNAVTISMKKRFEVRTDLQRQFIQIGG